MQGLRWWVGGTVASAVWWEATAATMMTAKIRPLHVADSFDSFNVLDSCTSGCQVRQLP